MGSDREKATWVDFGKIFFAVCVVGIHTGFCRDSTLVNTYIFPIAVPYFFMCSGFFLGRKIARASDWKDYRAVLAGYGKRLLVPYLFWGVWYFLMETKMNMANAQMTAGNAMRYQALSWLITSPGGGLWYVQTILILLMILWMANSPKYRIGLLIAGIGLSAVPSLVGQDYGEIMDKVMSSRVFLWEGMYFLMGIVVGEKTEKGLPNTVSIGLICLGIIGKVIGIGSGTGFIFKMLNLVTALGLFCLLYNTKAFYSKETSLVMRRWSTIIYFTHITVKYDVEALFLAYQVPRRNIFFFAVMFILLVWCLLWQRSGMKSKLYRMLYLG